MQSRTSGSKQLVGSSEAKAAMEFNSKGKPGYTKVHDSGQCGVRLFVEVQI